ncbi:Ras-related protein Rac1 [Hondaea fermentalgiana]|uniref:Ras-related protein Rac1 n=1 Tax=Hondaea fermentalgiana TaxID=2315210 RepID=A0A2R5GCV4_9STRA|nr:Ras-related protein Rac1 [Hondaea fermentalgiana]|eukprot:GBG28802.1 Ras-related protein Rac1 [Hondaea fermentalgiana]
MSSRKATIDDAMNTLKVVIVGDGAVGKTSLLISYSQGKFPTEYVPTVFDNFEKVIRADNKDFLMQLWDTAGQEEYDRMDKILTYKHARMRNMNDDDRVPVPSDPRVVLLFSLAQHLRPISYPETDVFLLCFSLAGDRSLTNVQKKWIPEVTKHCPDTPFILVGTKHDLKNEEALGRSTEELHELAEEVGAIGFVECSAKEMFNVDKIFSLAADTCLRNPAFRAPGSGLTKKASSPNMAPAPATQAEGGCCTIQ